MRSEYNVREVAVSDGIQTEFTFDFKIVDLAHLLVLVYRPSDGFVLWESRANSTTYFTTVLNEDFSGGTITPNDIPEIDTEVIMLLADDAPTQPSKFTADSRYTMKKIESSLDTLSGQIQRIRYLLDRSIRLPEKWTQALTTELAEVIPEAVPMVNETGDAFILVPRTDFKGDSGVDGLTPNIYFSADEPDPGIGDSGDLWIVSGDGSVYKNMSGIWSLQGFLSGGVTPDDKAYSVVESIEDPLNPGSFKPEWSDALSYVGFTERFNEIIDLKGIGAVLTYIMKMGYVAPNLSLGGSVSTALRERGDTISSVTLTGTFTKTLNDLTTLRFYLNPSTLLDTQAIGPGSGNGNTVYATPFSTDRTFRAEVDDNSAQPKPSKTATITYSFVYPYYVGAGAAGLGAGVSALTKRIINSTASRAETIAASGTQKLYFAYPASYGALTKIFDVNNFDTLADWTLTTTNITGLDGNPVSYRIYEFNNYPVAGSYLYTFVR